MSSEPVLRIRGLSVKQEVIVVAELKMIEAVINELRKSEADVDDRKSLLIIEGVRENGIKFRPSDWPERLSSKFGVFGRDHRLHYDPAVYPRVLNGQKVLAVALSLQWQNPARFKEVIKFARDNNLRIRDEQIVSE